MIAHARTSGRFGTMGPVCQRQTASLAVNARGARSSRERGSPNLLITREGGGIPYLVTLHPLPLLLAFASWLRVSLSSPPFVSF
jgi:hypothetical protein